MTPITTELVHIFVYELVEVRLRVRDFFAVLKTFGCIPLFGRVVVSLTHSRFPFSIVLRYSLCPALKTTRPPRPNYKFSVYIIYRPGKNKNLLPLIYSSSANLQF